MDIIHSIVVFNIQQHVIISFFIFQLPRVKYYSGIDQEFAAHNTHLNSSLNHLAEHYIEFNIDVYLHVIGNLKT